MAVQQGPTPDDTGLEVGQIQRGAQAEATDGLIGTVEQIVVDRNTGELRALIIRAADGRSEFELPAEYVRRSTGDHVYLALSNEQIANTPQLAQPYDPDQYVPVYEGQMEPVPAATEVAQETSRPIVTDVDTDSAQVVLPVTPERSPANQAQPPSPGDTPPAPRAPRAAPDDAEARTTTPQNAGQLTVPEQQALDESQQLFRYDEIYPQEPPRSPMPPTTPATTTPATTTPATTTPATTTPATTTTLAASAMIPAAEPLDDTGPLLGRVQPSPPPGAAPSSTGYPTPEPPTGLLPAAGLVGLAAAGLAVGVGTGALIALRWRRSQRPNVARSAASTATTVAETVTSSVSGAASAAQDAFKRLAVSAQPMGAGLASAAQDVAGQATESVTSAGKGAAQTIAEAGQSAGASLAAVNWRPRVFRWGLLLGALAGVLFAPRPGRVTRDRLAHQLNRVLSRAS